MFEKYPDIVGVDDVCDMLKIGKNKTYDLLRTNQIISKRIGKVYKIPKQSVIDYVLSSVAELQV